MLKIIGVELKLSTLLKHKTISKGGKFIIKALLKDKTN